MKLLVGTGINYNFFILGLRHKKCLTYFLLFFRRTLLTWACWSALCPACTRWPRPVWGTRPTPPSPACCRPAYRTHRKRRPATSCTLHNNSWPPPPPPPWPLAAVSTLLSCHRRWTRTTATFGSNYSSPSASSSWWYSSSRIHHRCAEGGQWSISWGGRLSLKQRPCLHK